MTTKKTAGHRPEVLLLSNERDISLDWVVRELRSRGVPFHRLNTERCAGFTWQVDPRRADWTVLDGDKRIRLGAVRSILYRRPEPPTVPGLHGADRRLALGQWAALVSGLSGLGAGWVSQPHMILRAESKILQLRTAHQIGLSVPPTTVTNSGVSARAFATRSVQMVAVKALDAPLVGPQSAEGFVFATLVPTANLDAISELEAAPFIVQEAVVPKTDLRVTVVGSRVLAAAAAAMSFDWRRDDPPPRFEQVTISRSLERKAVALVQALGLRFGALDFAVDAQGRARFLELNPNGEWGWLQRSGLPIAEAIVDELVRAIPVKH